MNHTEKPVVLNLHYFTSFCTIFRCFEDGGYSTRNDFNHRGVSKIGGDKDFSRLGIKTLFFYSLTGLLAAEVGLACVNVIEPGQVESEVRDKIFRRKFNRRRKIRQAIQNASNGWKGILEIFQRMIPKNCLKLLSKG